MSQGEPLAMPYINKSFRSNKPYVITMHPSFNKGCCYCKPGHTFFNHQTFRVGKTPEEMKNDCGIDY